MSVLERGGNAADAAVAARFCLSTRAHFPSSFWPRTAEPAGLVLERRIDTTTVTELRRRGHAVTVSGDWTLGRLSAVGVEAETGFLMAAANPRGGSGYAVGR